MPIESDEPFNEERIYQNSTRESRPGDFNDKIRGNLSPKFGEERLNASHGGLEQGDKPKLEVEPIDHLNGKLNEDNGKHSCTNQLRHYPSSNYVNVPKGEQLQT